jgi:sulfofructose kinase
VAAVRIACVGIAVLDHVFRVDELPRAPSKHLARGLQTVLGGMAANAAAAAARLGAEALLVSRVGSDAAGETILAELVALGVDTRAVERVAGLTSSVSAVFVDGAGERLLVNHADPRLLEDAPAPAEPLAGPVDAVLVDGRWPRAAVAALEAAAERRVPGLADLDHPMAEPWAGRLLAAASHVCFSRDGLARWTGEPGPEAGLRAIAARSAAELAVTLGAEGVLFRAADRLVHLPAFPVRAVDTLGAGDTFHGALAVALAEGRPWPAALRFASAAAALRCSRPSGRAAFPTRAEIAALLRAHAPEESCR